ncbi:MAG: DNRLRE domain-containing protein [Caldilineaceae bacterium]
MNRSIAIHLLSWLLLCTGLVSLWPPAQLRAQATTQTFQEGANGYAGTTDTKFYNWSAASNYGNHESLEHSTSRGTTSLLRFDLSSVPAESSVAAAQISLYLKWSDAGAGQTRTAQLHQMLVNWQENEATYNVRAVDQPWAGAKGPQPGADYATAPAAGAQTDQAGVWITWEVGPLVQSWINTPATNFGVILLDPNGYSVGANRSYASSEHGTAEWRPKLTITLGSTSSPTPTVTEPVEATATPTVAEPVEVTPTPAGAQSVVLQPGVNGYTGLADVKFYNWNAATNYGAHESLETTSSGTTASLLRFDLSSVPANSTVTTAQLSLYLKWSDAGNDLRPAQLHRMLVDWVEQEATYQQRAAGQPWAGNSGPLAGTDFAFMPTTSTQTGPAGVWITWAVTDLVQYWVSNPAANFGVLLRDPADYGNGGVGRSYASREHADVSWHPKLSITFDPSQNAANPPLPEPTVAPTNTPAPQPTADNDPSPGNGSGDNPSAPTPVVGPVQMPVLSAARPRLWLRPQDLPTLRSWAVPGNAIYEQGIKKLALDYKARMDSGQLYAEDCGCTFGPMYLYPVEWGAELFAFMSLIENDQTVRDDYAQRARTLLMYIMDKAALGPSPIDADYRGAGGAIFSTNMRSLFFGEAFPLTVDWIYPYLSAQDKATIRTVFLRWIQENLKATTSGMDHPEPVWVLNDPSLLSDKKRMRNAANNFYLAHMNQIGLMSLAFDAADDPGDPNVTGDQLRDYFANAVGAWLYVHHELSKTDAAGGIAVEGAMYGPTGFGRAAEFMLAIYTAGQADPNLWGPQVTMFGDPQWEAILPAFLHQVSPVPTVLPGLEYKGPVYIPTDHGDAQDVWMSDPMTLFGTMGLYARYTGNSQFESAARWIQTHIAPGGAPKLIYRAGDFNHVRDVILYFLLFDPNAPTPSDPRSGLALNHYAPGMGRLLSRTGWDGNARWFNYHLGWNGIDHQMGTGNMIDFYRKGEWLTKQWSGYGTYSSASEYKNTLALENDPPQTGISFWQANASSGSQYNYGPGGDPEWLAHSFGDGYTYASGEARNLYNNPAAQSTDILEAKRSVLWLQPDTIVLYDRAASKTAGATNASWLSLPARR